MRKYKLPDVSKYKYPCMIHADKCGFSLETCYSSTQCEHIWVFIYFKNCSETERETHNQENVSALFLYYITVFNVL